MTARPCAPAFLGSGLSGMAFLGTLYYYVHFLIILPLLGLLETPKPMPASISEAVLAKKRPSEPGQKLQAAQ